MALAANRPLRLMAPTTDESQEVDAMPSTDQTPANASVARAAGWAGAALSALAVLGLFYVPSLRLIWIVMLVLAVGAVPQAIWVARRQDRHKTGPRGR